MAHFFFDESATTQKIYMDRQFFSKFEDQVAALRGSKIVYVGNLSFYTSEAQIIASFQRAGPVRRVIMGLNRHTRTPCGFCFVEYFTNEAALDCIAHVSGTTLDDRVIRCELDFGFREGRQFGRGASGGQVRDDRRMVYDAGRALAGGGDDERGAAPAARGERGGDGDGDGADREMPPADEAAPRDDAADADAADDATASSRKRRRGNDDDDDDDDEDDD